MTENETKAVKFIENIKSHATVTLDHIAKEEPNVSPLVYKGREEKANTILVMVEELKQYRALGTPEELKELKERAFTGVELAQIAAMQMKLKEYEKTGTTEECRAAVEKRDRDRKNVRKDTKLTYRELAEYCETRADCSRCEKYELCERLSDYVTENLAPVKVVEMVDSKEKLS